MKYFIPLILSLNIFGCANFYSVISNNSSINNLKNKIDIVLSDSVFESTIAGIEIYSLNKGDILYSKNSKILFHPASNLKLLTSITILDNYNNNFSIPTQFYVDSISNSGTAHNLYVKGFGDPSFTLEKLNLIISQFKILGIKNISGNIYGDITYFDDNNWGYGWMWDDEPYYYAAYSSPLTIEGNSINAKVIPNTIVNEKPIVATYPKTNFVEIENNSITTNDSVKTEISITRDSFKRNNNILISGTISQKSDTISENLSIVGPEFYFLQLIKENLISNNIIFNGNIELKSNPQNPKLIIQHDEPIDSIITRLNKISDNLSCENLLKFISADKISIPGSTKKGIWLVNKTLSKYGIDTNSILIVDGSGMSHYNLLSASHFTTILKSVYNNKDLFKRFYNSLPIAGIDGTLSARMKNSLAENNLRAKTGSISGVSTLSGYVKAKNGEMLVFSMQMQNFIGSSSQFRNAQNKIGEILANFER